MTSDVRDRAPHPAVRRLRQGVLRMVTAVAGGLVLYLAFAPSTRWWAAPLGLALFGLAVDGLRGRSALGLAVVFGAAFYIPLLSWTGVYVGSVPWLALAGVEALLVGPVGVLLVWCRTLPGWPFWAAAAWVAGEAWRARLPFGGFPWGSVAFSQADGPLLPTASLLGAAGLTFVTALAGFGLTAVLLAGWAGYRRTTAGPANPEVRGPQGGDGPRTAGHHHHRTREPGWVLGAVVIVAAFAVGLLGRATTVSAADADAAPQARIAVIQGNVPKPGLDFNDRRRAVTDNHAQRTHELAAAVRAGSQPQPAVVIWPENSSDIDPYTNADAAQVIQSAVDDIGVPVLVGAVVAAPEPKHNYNMAIVWYPGSGPGETYTKRHPVPFAEYMPYRSFFRFFSDKVDLLQSDFLPGTRPGNFTIGGVPIGDLICFEIVEDGLTRDVLRGGAGVLVVQTNNATFGYTDETYQQQAMSRVRAVEHGREVLIAATSGVSAVIRPDGSVESTVPLFTPGYLVPSVPVLQGATPGTALGAPVEWTAAAATPLALLLAFALRRRRTTGLAARELSDDGGQTRNHRSTVEQTQEEPTP